MTDHHGERGRVPGAAVDWQAGVRRERRPALAVPGAALLLLSGLAAMLWARRFAAAADRWVKDPPEPPREPELDPDTAQRHLTAFLVSVGVLLAALLVVALVTD